MEGKVVVETLRHVLQDMEHRFNRILFAKHHLFVAQPKMKWSKAKDSSSSHASIEFEVSNPSPAGAATGIRVDKID